MAKIQVTLDDATFSHSIVAIAPTNLKQDQNILKASCLPTSLGPMLAIADEYALYLLEFMDQPNLADQINQLKQSTCSVIIAGQTSPIISIEAELKSYFKGNPKEFNTPTSLSGSLFQASVWNVLKQIPFGELRSYADIAKAVGKLNAFRAVAQANRANRLAIIIPCHRVVYANGDLGGYSGGLARKEWLINHEKIENRALA